MYIVYNVYMLYSVGSFRNCTLKRASKVTFIQVFSDFFVSLSTHLCVIANTSFVIVQAYYEVYNFHSLNEISLKAEFSTTILMSDMLHKNN